ncbi:MAG: hypothetical protein JRM79_04935 [Nitrososphaerota archaeon]|nr:hypothetical protein [Nitrososphaerota archaeon]MDG6953194.1 hypothetical protein [Nitrososphaerota archaeon]MDG6958970.1 hypothetical protein [Nitrososphaerota archaeon]MDG6959954.1 hypothetical protein [Nitrososphaerota archaeon]MDG6981845.1 hypothetical protein [Nitrososphaerota archaeon]
MFGSKKLTFQVKDPMRVICRIEGSNQRARELTAFVDFNSTHCLMFAHDAIYLGYSDVANRAREWREIFPQKTPYLISFRGIERGILVNLKRVSIGPLSTEGVSAVCLEAEPSMQLPYDVVLGRSFLDKFKVTYDGRAKLLSLS